MTDAPQSRVESAMHVDLKDRVSYGSYLRLDQLLGAQKPLTAEHDEMMFVIVHHVQELWLKLVAHELTAAIAAIQRDELSVAFKSTARVSRIQEQLLQAWDVLSTMTPADYLKFRGAFGAASGFQSYQYRLVEFTLGAKDAKMLLPHRHNPEAHAMLDKALHARSIYDEALALLARRGFAVPASALDRDFSIVRPFDPAVRDLWADIYRHADTHFDLYQLAEELVDLEDWFQQWRFRHMKTVERIIGFKRGSGGSSGVGFLRTAIDMSFFPELWDVRT
ncbi:MAG: tryptophan 2,3-dioxygenase, partial [Beijerinckiaceae bacterium]